MTQKKYKVVEEDNFKYTLECRVCKAKFRVPKNHGRIVAKCPSCQLKHSIDTDQKHSKINGIDLENIKNMFYKRGKIDVKLVYLGIFAFCVLLSILKSF